MQLIKKNPYCSKDSNYCPNKMQVFKNYITQFSTIATIVWLDFDQP